MTINEGFFVANETPCEEGGRAAFCVLGMPRGGTTLTAKLLQAAGVFMGTSVPLTLEDRDFGRILNQPSPDPVQFEKLVSTRGASHARWGFKAPFRNHWDLLCGLPNVRFVVVFRDVLAVANRNHISAGEDVMQSISANLGLQSQLLQFVSTVQRPAFMFSYEKALLKSVPLIEALMDFCGSSGDDLVRIRMMEAICPNEIGYLELMERQAHRLSGNVDVLDCQRIAGWARAASGKRVNVRVIVNGETVAEVLANRPRADLQRHFGDAGDYAFEVPLNAELYSGKPLSVEVRDAGTGAVLARRAIPA